MAISARAWGEAAAMLPFLRRRVESRVRSPHLAADCVQEAVLELAGRIAAGGVPTVDRDRYAAAAVRYAIPRALHAEAVVTVNGYARYQARRRGSTAAALGASALAPMGPPEWHAAEREPVADSDPRMAADIERALAGLTPKQAEVFRMRAAGISQRAVADELGMRRESVKQVERAAVAKLRKALADYA